MNGTKEKILDAALNLFSQRGYSGTSMSDIAASLNLTKAALYKHYGSKEEILDSLFDRIEAYYSENFGSKEHLPEAFGSADGLVSLTMRMVDFTVNDDRIVKVRKILTIEQFRNERACALATRHFLTGLEELFTGIFGNMIEQKLLKDNDPEMLAFAYTAPVSALVLLCDREPGKKGEAFEKIRAFSEHFVSTYGEN